MKDIKVLGTGCAKCKSTVAIIEQVASAKGVPVKLEKIEDIKAHALQLSEQNLDQAIGIIRSWLKEPVKAGAVPAKAA